MKEVRKKKYYNQHNKKNYISNKNEILNLKIFIPYVYENSQKI